ncbi:MAG TPA: serine hydrolase domain-containing protein [Bacteroidales bacterium]|nr:serine hydrolase domain-containing protein [Bacteroidales bacterium]
MNLVKASKAIFLTMIFLSSALLGQKPDKLEKISRFIESKRKSNNIPGMGVAIVHNDSIIFSRGFGKDGNGNPVNTNTPFAIASLSKAFTAMAVMQLIDAGKIDPDIPFIHYLHSFELSDPRYKEITIRQLLNQTSGLSDIVFPEMKFREQPESLTKSIERLKNVRLNNDPGKQFHYHNPNYQILALLVETVSNESFSDYLHKNILIPLEMNNTSMVSNTKEMFDSSSIKLSRGHVFYFGIPVKINEPQWFVEGAAGMISTVNNMANWMILQIKDGDFKNRQILSKNSIQMMYSPPGNIESSYGMGWIKLEKNSFYHSGLLWTYEAEEIILKDRNYGIIVLSNGGLSVFQDYYSFIQGISDILNNQKPEKSFFSKRLVGLIFGLLALATIISGLYRLSHLKKWVVKTRNCSKWRIRLRFLPLLLPVLFLLSIPVFITLSGRALNFERIFLIMPEVIIWLGLWSIFNTIIFVARVKILSSSKS